MFALILQLNPESFRDFGIILPESKADSLQLNRHSIPLSADTTVSYEAAAETGLACEQGLAILSVSADGVQYQDFYLDKPLTLRPGIHFRLTGFQKAAVVACTGSSLPRLTGTQPARLQISTQPSLQVTELYTFFYQEKEPGFLFSGESHSMLELTYVDQGSLHSVADGVDMLLQQGQMVLYAPEQWHMQYADIEVAPRYVTLSFHATGVQLQDLYNRVLHPGQQARRLLQSLLQEQERTDAYTADMLIHTLEILLISLLRQSDKPSDKLQSPHCVNAENEIIRQAQQFVSLHVRQKLSVPIVARAVDVSASYLTALFHKHLQLSPGEYIRRIKLQESKQLIREGNMNFTEIAEALQYSTVHHFSRQFKEKFGITPTEYARSVR